MSLIWFAIWKVRLFWPVKRTGTIEANVLNESLDKICDHSARIFKIVKGIRAFSRDARQDPMVSIALKSVVMDSLALVNSTVRDTGVSIDVSGMRDDMLIDCRPSQLMQVFLNLFQNALDAFVDAGWRQAARSCRS